MAMISISIFLVISSSCSWSHMLDDQSDQAAHIKLAGYQEEGGIQRLLCNKSSLM